MKRDEFEHAIRAAAAILGVRELRVIGSQALQAGVAGELPPEASRSMEVDVAALRERLAKVKRLDQRVRAAVVARIPA